MSFHEIEIVAHRAGNTVGGPPRVVPGHIIEMDAHVLYGRVEVRHEKVVRPFRRLWERWYLLPRGARGVPIDEVLELIDERTPIMLDLKCSTRRAARRIVAKMPSAQPLIVSTRAWWVLSTCADRPNTRRLRSCGNRLQLLVAATMVRRGSDLGISVHERLVDADALADLDTCDIFSWAATSTQRCRELVESGVTGLILDDPDIAGDVSQT